MKSICKLLFLAALIALSIATVAGQSGNRMRFVLSTGSDDFSSGSALFLTVNLTDGSKLPGVRITNEGVSYARNRTSTVTANIGQMVELSAIRSVTLSFTGASLHGYPRRITDIWNLDAIEIALIDQNNNRHLFYNSRNDPARSTQVVQFRHKQSITLTSQFPIQPPGNACAATRLTVVPRGGSCGQLVNILFPDRPLSAPASDCGQQYFPQNRTDVWYTFTMPASGRVAIDFNSVTTAILYTGESCNALTASGACRLDAGGNKGETFINFEAPRSTQVYLRVFGSAGSRRTLCVYEW